jgi:hypothetical protein
MEASLKKAQPKNLIQRLHQILKKKSKMIPKRLQGKGKERHGGFKNIQGVRIWQSKTKIHQRKNLQEMLSNEISLQRKIQEENSPSWESLCDKRV